MNYLVLDVETTISNNGNPFDDNNKLVYVGLYGHGLFPIEYGDEPYQENLDKIQAIIDKYDFLVGFNIKFDLHWLAKYGITFSDKRIWDCQLSQFILEGQNNPYQSLNRVCEHYGLDQKLDVVKEEYWKNGIDTPDIPRDILEVYLLQDLNLTDLVFQKQVAELENNPTMKRLISLHNQDLLVLQEMEFNGLLFNQSWSETLGHELEEQIAKLDKKLYTYHNLPDFNPNSNDHISVLLYGGDITYRVQVDDGFYKTGLKKGQPKVRWDARTAHYEPLCKPIKGTELVKEGYYSTDEKTLKSLKGSKKAKEVIDILLTRSELNKRMTTYYQGLPNLIKEMNWQEGKIYGQLNQCVARTGRLSSSRPNLQNFDGEIKGLFYSRYKEVQNV
jgi:DNA polymerase I-like protein with 3'-5' exonuclease and polymerase domains